MKNKPKLKKGRGALYYISLCIFILSISSFVGYGAWYVKNMYSNRKLSSELSDIRNRYSREERAGQVTEEPVATDTPTPTPLPTDTPTPTPTGDPEPLPNGDPTPTPEPTPTPTNTPTPTPKPPEMTEYGKAMYAINPDFVGHLEVVGVDPIDYEVVMEREWDDTFYLKHLFNGEVNNNGTLFTLNECEVGVGRKSNNYLGGKKPSTNIIIFGHNMINNDMFGNLELFLSQAFYEKHKIVYFDTAYEARTYEVIAVFRSHQFEDPFDDNFKYYFFYNANSELDFDYWYSNIKSASEIKCTATAKYGDEFLTLSTCSKTDETGKKNEDGRLAVIAVRID